MLYRKSWDKDMAKENRAYNFENCDDLHRNPAEHPGLGCDALGHRQYAPAKVGAQIVGCFG